MFKKILNLLLETSHIDDHEKIKNAFFLGAGATLYEISKAKNTGNLDDFQDIEKEFAKRLEELENGKHKSH
jgi:hypothetical protein